MQWIALTLVLVNGIFVASAFAKQPLTVQVADPFLELRTGPGRGFPVFHVIERGEVIEIRKRRTDWFKIRTDRGTTGWTSRHELEQTLSPDGEAQDFTSTTFADFARRRWEFGFMGGDFEGAELLSAYAGYALSPVMSVEISASQAVSDFATHWMADGSVIAQPFPRWRLSPFFGIGGGVVNTEPKVTLVQRVEETNDSAHATIGFKLYLTRQFIMRVEYRNQLLFVDEENNEETEIWKVGFAGFF